jgi:hypothetical protein
VYGSEGVSSPRSMSLLARPEKRGEGGRRRRRRRRRT